MRKSILTILLIGFVFLTFVEALNDDLKNKYTPIEFIHKSKECVLENTFFEVWKNDPATLYRSLLKRRKDAESRNQDFLLPEMAISVIKITESLDKRLLLENELKYLNEREIYALKNLLHHFQSILSKGIPYQECSNAIFSYLELMDGIFKRLDPTLPTSIAKLLTEDKFLNLILEQNLFIFFSFKSLDIDFFVRTRPAPIYVIGLVDYPSFGHADQAKIKVDGYDTEIGGFSHHDAEHARADWKLDSTLFIQQNPEEITREWQQVRDWIESKISQLEIENNDLARASMILLFEILHERGLQFDLSTLKSYLNLPLFSKTTKDKWLSLFWDPLPGKYEIYDLFDQAEEWLNHQISELLIKRNKDKFTEGYSLVSTIETITMGEGFVQQVKILEEDDIRVYLSESLQFSSYNNLSITSLYHIKTFGLVEVNPKEKDFIFLLGKSRFLQTKFNQLLKLWKNQQKLSYTVVKSKYFIPDKLVKIMNESNDALFQKGNQVYRLKLDSIVIR